MSSVAKTNAIALLTLLLVVVALACSAMIYGTLDELVLTGVLSISVSVTLPGSIVVWCLANRQPNAILQKLWKFFVIINAIFTLNADFSALTLLGVINWQGIKFPKLAIELSGVEPLFVVYIFVCFLLLLGLFALWRMGRR